MTSGDTRLRYPRLNRLPVLRSGRGKEWREREVRREPRTLTVDRGE